MRCFRFVSLNEWGSVGDGRRTAFSSEKKNADLLCEWNSYVDEVTAGREFLASISSDQSGSNNKSPFERLS